MAKSPRSKFSAKQSLKLIVYDIFVVEINKKDIHILKHNLNNHIMCYFNAALLKNNSYYICHPC